MYEEIKNRFQIRYTDAGLQNLKNIAEPVRVYQISVSETPAPKTIRNVPKLNWTAGVGLLVILVLGMAWWIDRKSSTTPPADALAPQLQMTLQPIAESAWWDSIKESHRSADFNAYLEKFPNGLFAEVARTRLARIAFDGVWSVKVACPERADGAIGTTKFIDNVRVTESVLDFWSGTPNANRSWHMYEEINSDGTAYLELTGLTSNNPKTAPQGPGTRYQNHVRTRFTDKQGLGTGEGREPCEFTFTRQNSGSALSGTAPPANALAPRLQMAENLLWDSIKESLNAYLEKFPNGVFAGVARDRLARFAFDGVWSARMVCPEAPDGTKAYTAVFSHSLRIAEGALDGWSGTPNANGTFRLRGQIKPDGSAQIGGTGVTGDNPEYAFGRAPPGQFFQFLVRAKFTPIQAKGTRLDKERPCELTFARED